MNTINKFQPLADRLRPQNLEKFFGQSHLLAPGKPLYQAIKSGLLHSMILWGPPGTGKTTLANMLAQAANARIEKLSAVLAGVKDIRSCVERAEEALEVNHQRTILFVDEVHRFNKSQQDAFLPHVESGLLTLIGATTENPSFELNNALLSRCRTYVLKDLDGNELAKILDNALKTGLNEKNIEISLEGIKLLIASADGDARRLLNHLEICADFAEKNGTKKIITENIIKEILTHSLRRFDKNGEDFYNQISALHKAVRGSDPDAALYWLCRMLDGGCDPKYIARRIIRIASEDIGNADPRALEITLNAALVYDRLGSPEGELALAQAVIYLSVAAKSNAAYMAFNEAMNDAKKSGSLEVPLHIRNAPTKLMKELGYGKNYRYAHDEVDAYAAGENYFPEKLSKRQYYHPTDRGLEIKIKEKLESLS
ncbi:MAG: replication-associated recombination protein A [Gammaproteobacteria bacterium]|nr:replication-associated recombination protein A [Gammaproteobacteria bacterium]